MNVYYSQYFIKRYRKITKKNQQLKQSIKKVINQFIKSPRHPTLHLHKLKGKMVDDWSISVEANMRIIFTYIKDGILLVDIGSHDEVYR